VRVPQQLAIAGFGDFELARASNPALTTVRIPGERIGRTAARLIADRLAGLADDGPRAIDLGFELVSRASA
jgi:LacI family gluconate utilization system Gnt-I transcriptional repressor